MLYDTIYITVLGTGDKQTGFCRNGNDFKASIDALIILRGFFSFKIRSFKLSSLRCLRDYKRSKLKSRLCRHLTTCTMTKYEKDSPVGRRFDSVVFLAKLWFESTLNIRQQKGDSRPMVQIHPFSLHHGITQRVMTFFASCEQFRYSKRFDCWNGNIITLTLYMGGGFRSWGKGVVWPKIKGEYKMLEYEWINEGKTAVFLTQPKKQRIGKISLCSDHKYRYFPKGSNGCGEPFDTLRECKKSLEED